MATRAGEAVAARIAATSWYRGHQRIVLYAARFPELPLDGLFTRASADGKAILWPRITGDRLEFARADRLEALVPGVFGIPAPAPEAPAIPLGSGDLVILPGLAFDRHGARLGRGRSFFDRALAQSPSDQAYRCGVGYAFQWLPRIPEEAWDLRLDAFVSPDRTEEWEGRG